MDEPFHAMVVSDCHIGNHLPHSVAGPDGVTDRLVDQLDALEWCFGQAEQWDLPLVCLGDLFDDHLVDTITLDMLGETLSHGLPPKGFYVVPGNHDAHDQTNRHFSPAAISRLTGDGGIRILNDLGKPEVEPFAGRGLVRALPFCTPEVARRFFADHARSDRLLLGHMEVNGFGHGGSWLCSNGLGEDELKPWGAVLTGHFHARQEFRHTHGGYPGALCQLKFDDAGKPQGGWVVRWDGDQLEREFVEYEGAASFDSRDLAATDLANLCDEADLAGADMITPSTFMRLVVSGTDEELVRVPWDKVRAALKDAGARRVVFDHKPVAGVEKHRLEVEVGAPLEDLLDAYIEHPSIKVRFPAIDAAGLKRLGPGGFKGKLLGIGLRVLRTAQERQKQLPSMPSDDGGDR